LAAAVEEDDDDDGANTDADGGGGGVVVVVVVVVVDGDDDDDDPAACGEAKEKDSLRKAGGGVESPVAGAGAGAAAVVAGCLCWAGVPGVEAAAAVVTDSGETAAAAGCAAGAPPPADDDGDRVRLGDVTPLAADCSIYGLWRHRRLRKKDVIQDGRIKLKRWSIIPRASVSRQWFAPLSKGVVGRARPPSLFVSSSIFEQKQKI
jgi:hypothetical protein